MRRATKLACPRLFEVEALRDGRLAGPEIARVRAHAGLCHVCAAEAEALDALARALRSSARAERDELHVRRERTRLLGAFDARLVQALRGGRSRAWWAAVAAVVVVSSVAALGVTLATSRLERARRATVATPAKPAEAVSIRVEGNARFSRRTEQHVERIVLESGSLAIRVPKARAARRLVVVLPDGELEDIGTTFTVSAAGARTTRVTVEEGSVILRLHGSRPLVLAAGESWPPSSRPSAAKPAPSSAPSAVPSEPEVLPSSRRATAPRASVTSGSAVVAPAARSDPSADFRVALSALNSGDHAGAARLLTTFLANHPHDARSEDAAYLRVIAFQRSGDESATERASSDYLRRFSAGFRRAEVEALKASLRRH